MNHLKGADRPLSSIRKELLAAVRTILPLDDGVLIEFGNRAGNDLDLLAVVPSSTQLSWTLGDVDLLVLTRPDCEQLIELLDPLVTEPIRMGRAVGGSPQVFEDLHEKLARPTATAEATSHLLHRALDNTHAARTWLQQYSAEPSARSADFFLRSLSFAVSSYRTAQRVNTGQISDLSMDALMADCPLLKAIREVQHALHRIPCPEGIAALLEAWERILLDGPKEI